MTEASAKRKGKPVRDVPAAARPARGLQRTVEGESGPLHVEAELELVDGRFVATEVTIRSERGITAGDLRRVPMSQLDREANNGADVMDAFFPLERPERDPRGAGDAFYRRVALRYGQVVRETRAPAPVLAAEAEVPVTTVHRWVREARRRGFLPPARPGAAG